MQSCTCLTAPLKVSRTALRAAASRKLHCGHARARSKARIAGQAAGVTSTAQTTKADRFFVKGRDPVRQSPQQGQRRYATVSSQLIPAETPSVLPQSARHQRASTQSHAVKADAPAHTVRALSPPSAAVLKELVQELTEIYMQSTGRSAGLSGAEASQTRVLSFASSSGGSEEEESWLARLENLTSEIRQATSGHRRNTRVLVLSPTRYHAAEFSMALLDDPLASDRRLTEALQDRLIQTSGEQRLVLSTNSLFEQSAPQSEAAATALPFPWLSRNHVEIIERVHRDNSPLSPEEWSDILLSDTVFILSGVPASILGGRTQARLARKANVIRLCSHEELQHQTQPENLFARPEGARSIKLPQLIVDPALAIEANRTLSGNSQKLALSTSATTDFATMLLRSGVPQLRELVEGLADVPLEGIASSNIPVSHRATYASQLSDLAYALSDAVVGSSQLVSRARGEVANLQLRHARDKRHSQLELGFTDLDKLDLDMLINDIPADPQRHLGGEEEEVALANAAASDGAGQHAQALLDDGRRDMQNALNHKRLKWWKLPFGRADDIATDLNTALVTYFAGLERKLTFETGRLSERSLASSAAVDALFKPPGSFAKGGSDFTTLYSATLQNELQQLSPSTAFSFPPPSHPSPNNLLQTSFTKPIIDRRIQLASPGGPLEKLQLRAQSAVLQYYAIAGGSTAAATFMSITPVEAFSVSVASAIGAGLLGNATAAWLLQGKWRKAQTGFWKDWLRAQEGLSCDLQANADEVLNTKVFLKTEVAKRRLSSLIVARAAALESVTRRLQHVTARLS